MLLDRYLRSAGQIRIYPILSFIALFALLVARDVPPTFPKASPFKGSSVTSVSTISAISSRDQRPRFDCNGLFWSVPVRAFLPFPPTAKASHLTSASEIFPVLSIKGYHYNRPPPIV